eukprot:scaffold47_cov334-Pavlova_lutheri.AAC.41
MGSSSTAEYPFACLLGDMVFCIHPQETQGHIIQHGTEHGGASFNVQAVSTVLVLVVPEVPLHFFPMGRREDPVQLTHGVQRDEQSWHQEHRPSVVTRPVSVVLLQSSVKPESSTERTIEFGFPFFLLEQRPPAHGLDAQQRIVAVLLVPSLGGVLPSRLFHLFQGLCIGHLLVVDPHLPSLHVARDSRASVRPVRLASSTLPPLQLCPRRVPAAHRWCSSVHPFPPSSVLQESTYLVLPQGLQQGMLPTSTLQPPHGAEQVLVLVLVPVKAEHEHRPSASPPSGPIQRSDGGAPGRPPGLSSDG